MRELSLHIMDVVENGIAAGATLIDITVAERRKENRLEITIKDNGRGIPAHLLEQVLNPFYTTRTTRRVGLGEPTVRWRFSYPVGGRGRDGGLCLF